MLIFSLFALLIMGAGVVTIAALVINAIVKAKLAKDHSIHVANQVVQEQDGVWPPPPSV